MRDAGTHGRSGLQIPSRNLLYDFGEARSACFAINGEGVQNLLATYAMLSRIETPYEAIVRLFLVHVIVSPRTS